MPALTILSTPFLLFSNLHFLFAVPAAVFRLDARSWWCRSVDLEMGQVGNVFDFLEAVVLVGDLVV